MERKTIKGLAFAFMMLFGLPVFGQAIDEARITELGIGFIQQENYSEAVNQFEQIVDWPDVDENARNRAQAYITLCQCLEATSQGDYGRALALGERVIGVDWEKVGLEGVRSRPDLGNWIREKQRYERELAERQAALKEQVADTAVEPILTGLNLYVHERNLRLFSYRAGVGYVLPVLSTKATPFTMGLIDYQCASVYSLRDEIAPKYVPQFSYSAFFEFDIRMHRLACVSLGLDYNNFSLTNTFDCSTLTVKKGNNKYFFDIRNEERYSFQMLSAPLLVSFNLNELIEPVGLSIGAGVSWNFLVNAKCRWNGTVNYDVKSYSDVSGNYDQLVYSSRSVVEGEANMLNGDYSYSQVYDNGNTFEKSNTVTDPLDVMSTSIIAQVGLSWKLLYVNIRAEWGGNMANDRYWERSGMYNHISGLLVNGESFYQSSATMSDFSLKPNLYKIQIGIHF